MYGPPLFSGSLDWAHICRASTKVVTFIDLAGHEKYLKTTIFGMTGHAPDFCMLMVGSNAGVIGMTKGKPLLPSFTCLWCFICDKAIHYIVSSVDYTPYTSAIRIKSWLHFMHVSKCAPIHHIIRLCITIDTVLPYTL